MSPVWGGVCSTFAGVCTCVQCCCLYCTVVVYAVMVPIAPLRCFTMAKPVNTQQNSGVGGGGGVQVHFVWVHCCPWRHPWHPLLHQCFTCSHLHNHDQFEFSITSDVGIVTQSHRVSDPLLHQWCAAFPDIEHNLFAQCDVGGSDVGCTRGGCAEFLKKGGRGNGMTPWIACCCLLGWEAGSTYQALTTNTEPVLLVGGGTSWPCTTKRTYSATTPWLYLPTLHFHRLVSYANRAC